MTTLFGINPLSNILALLVETEQGLSLSYPRQDPKVMAMTPHSSAQKATMLLVISVVARSRASTFHDPIKILLFGPCRSLQKAKSKRTTPVRFELTPPKGMPVLLEVAGHRVNHSAKVSVE
jgi:hypothetical protein